MSKQGTRQNSKQNQTANKRATQQVANGAQSQPKNKQATTQIQPQSKQLTRQAQRQTRRATSQQRQAQQRSATRTKNIVVISVIAAVLLVAAVSVYFLAFSPSAASQTAAVYNPVYQPVDGIYCDQQEKTAFHIHAHLSMYINGKLVVAPANVGIVSDNLPCFYWLHVHNPDGIVHIEAPAGHAFTLGNFFDVWSRQFQQLSYPYQLDVSQGWTTYVNGKLYTGDFRSIPLGAHALITLMLNSPNAKPDTTYSWGSL